jgi:hypothetical protein
MKYKNLPLTHPLPLIFIATLLTNCSKNQDGMLKEISRKTSPDGKVDAIVAVHQGNATVANAFYVFIVPKNRTIKNYDINYSVFKCDHQEELKIGWIENRLLNISFKKARIFSYSNFWHHEKLDSWNYMVEMKINSTSHKRYLQP